MHIRITTDPVFMVDVADLEDRVCLYDGENGLEIYFESESNLEAFIEWDRDKVEDHHVILKDNDAEEFIA